MAGSLTVLRLKAQPAKALANERILITACLLEAEELSAHSRELRVLQAKKSPRIQA
jgi:hypothetical protein